MVRELISDVISLVNPYAGLASKYLFKITDDPNDSIKSSLEKIEKVLGLSKKDLTKLELDLMEYILNISSNKNESLDNINVECSELKKVLEISSHEFDDIRYSLGDLLTIDEAMGNYCVCKLDYSIFWKTNYLDMTTDKSLNFEYLYAKMIKYLYDEKRYDENEIDVKSFEEFFSIEQINPLLAYMEKVGVAKFISYRRPQITFYYRSFFIDKNKLYKEYDLLK